MNFRSAFDVGFTNELGWYHTISILFFFFITITLALCIMGIAVGNNSTWMSHKQFCKLLVPVKIHWTSLLYILMSISVKVAVHTASHIFSIYNRLSDVMLLKALAVVASFGRYGISSWALSADIMSAPLGKIDHKVGAFDL